MTGETYLDVSSCPTCAGPHAVPPPSDGLRIYFEETVLKKRYKHLHFRRQAGVETTILARKDQTPDSEQMTLPEPPEEDL